MAGILFIISAPSGSGKSTLVNRLRPRVDNLDFSVSYTTRAPRGAEQEGQDYHFTTRIEFEQMIDEGEFLEHASVFGNYYGTACQSLRDAEAQGKDLLLDIDVQGAAQVQQKVPEAVSIFVLPPNPAVLGTRLRNRSLAEGSVSEAVIARRLSEARNEIENYRRYSYILVNDILERAEEELFAIVMSERARHSGVSMDAEQERLMELAESCRQENAVDRLRPVLTSFGLISSEAAHA